MIELHITKTCLFATTGRNAGWQRYDQERKAFSDMPAAREWLTDQYGKAKRAAMYRDQKDAPPLRCGYVIGFRPPYRRKGEAILEQHWIEFRDCAPVNLDEARV